MFLMPILVYRLHQPQVRDKEFRQWVIAHELAHEFGFIHEDSLLIMGQYNKRNSLEAAMDELAIEIHKKNVQ